MVHLSEVFALFVMSVVACIHFTRNPGGHYGRC